MCGRYSLISSPGLVKERFGADFTADFAPTYNAAPSQHLPVITNAAPQQVRLMQWGLVPAWVKDRSSGPQPINARAETLAEKPSFRQLLQRRRCLVLADSFYEWQQKEAHGLPPKTPHRILLTSGQPYAFAGLWDEWLDRATGEILPTFTIVTTEPNALMAPLHHRMPVLLEGPEAEQSWLSDAVSAADHQALLRPYPAELMREYVISKLVNSPAHNEPAVLEPAS
ncbi:SOS response-associated peptidase [Hymenobacter rubripertinctus]|uniref:Abasic site processing protein n=1 Tax=Hymenobacter rubripertinctus TaxID=2029981 RepID=A0A418R1N1_9BACT|nr:SOS response-associated peptidase [Hymenobacter rubripertinctus]RIY11370.1 SOS response-associated peptidase [Hymenobacter rubripertinctus]